jgi:hypothetical protein
MLEVTFKDGEPFVTTGTRCRRATEVICLNCGRHFYAPTNEINRGWGKFCGKSCRNIYRFGIKRMKRITCKICGRSRMVKQSNADRYATCGRPECQSVLRSRIARKTRRNNPRFGRRNPIVQLK